MNVGGTENTIVLHFKEAAYCGAHMESESFTEEVGAGVPRSAIANATIGVGAAEGTQLRQSVRRRPLKQPPRATRTAVCDSLRLPDYGIHFSFQVKIKRTHLGLIRLLLAFPE